MAIDLKSISSNPTIAPPRVVIYGPDGVGKSTFGANAPHPIFLLLEDGLGALSVPHFPLLKSWDEVLEALGALYEGEHKYATVVVDSIDWLEPIVWAETCRRHDKKDIEDFGYGRGYVFACDVWREFFAGLTALRGDRSMAVVLVAHAQIKRFDDPANEPYDRYQLKLHDRAAALTREWADAVLFANWRTYTAKSDVGFNKKVTRGTSAGERLIWTEERPSHHAKNRYSLPPELPLSWDAFQAALTGENQAPAPVEQEPETA